jgi:hypothetical protein
LAEYTEALIGLGGTDIVHLQDIEDADLDEINMKKLHRRTLRREVAKFIAGEAAAEARASQQVPLLPRQMSRGYVLDEGSA